jgi:putative ABC transport system permease protein
LGLSDELKLPPIPKGRLRRLPKVTPYMTQLELYAAEFLNLETGETAPRKFVTIGILMGLLFMVLPAINLVNINLSRISERSAEIGVRKAFGAPFLHLHLCKSASKSCLAAAAVL